MEWNGYEEIFIVMGYHWTITCLMEVLRENVGGVHGCFERESWVAVYFCWSEVYILDLWYCSVKVNVVTFGWGGKEIKIYLYILWKKILFKLNRETNIKPVVGKCLLKH